jgi:hypothetical protein
METVVWATYGTNMERHGRAVKAAQKHGEVKEREEHPPGGWRRPQTLHLDGRKIGGSRHCEQ